MTVRIPLVLQNGQPEELQSGDQLSIVSPISGLTAGRLAVSASASTLQDYPGGTFDGTTLAVPTINPTNVGTLPSFYNYLINGGFDYFQRTAPGTLTAIANDTYGPDRWNILTQTTTVQIQRVAGNIYSVSAGELKQNQAAAQRMGLCQILEASSSVSIRGKTVIAQAKIKCSSSQPIRIAILEWTGTADAPTSNVVKDWTSGTFTANNFFLTSSLTVTAVSAVTPSAATWTTLSVTGTVSASCNNFIVFIWTEGTAAQNVTLDVTEVGLYTGAQIRNWEPRLAQQELAMCQRYYEKSYGIDTPPGTATTSSCNVSAGINSYWCHQLTSYYKMTKRVIVGPTIYSTYTASTTGKATQQLLSNSTFDGDITASVLFSGANNWSIVLTAFTYATDYATWHWTDDCEL